MKPYLFILFSLALKPMHLQAQEWFPLGAKWTYTYLNAETSPPLHYGPYHLEILSLDSLDGFQVGAVQTTFFCPIDLQYLGFKNDSVCFWDSSLEKRLLFDLSTTVGDSFKINLQSRCSSPSNMMYDTLSFRIDSIYNEIYNGLTVRVFTGFKRTYNANFSSEIPFLFYEYFGFDTWTFTNMCDACESILQDLRCYEDPYFMQQQLGVLACDTSYHITAIREEQVVLNTIHLLPNPVQDYLQIQFDLPNDKQTTSFEIYNLSGQIVFEEKTLIQNQSHVLNVNKMVPGIYALRLSNEAKETWTKIFVKE